MAARSGFRVEGLNQVVRDLTAFGLEVDDLKGAFSKIAAVGAAAAARHAPRKTGRLAGDIRGNRAKSKAVVTAGRASVPYAGPINYGWAKRNISAAGFMQAADHEVAPVAISMLEAEINAVIRRKGLS